MMKCFCEMVEWQKYADPWPVKRQSDKMVKSFVGNSLWIVSVFDHFVGLALKGLYSTGIITGGSHNRKTSASHEQDLHMRRNWVLTLLNDFVAEITTKGVFRTQSNIEDKIFPKIVKKWMLITIFAKKTLCHGLRSGVFIVNFKHISHLILMFLLLALSK